MGGTLWAARAAKTLTAAGQWKSGKMSKADFPLSKNNSFRLGTGWEYSVYELSGSHEMRLLIAFHPGKREYLAWLAVKADNDNAIVARLEYHRSHTGWHVHLKPDDMSKLAYGVVKQQGEKRVVCKSGIDPAIGQHDALALAYRVFNVQPKPWEMTQ